MEPGVFIVECGAWGIHIVAGSTENGERSVEDDTALCSVN